jgi:hypothetical protein
MSTSTGSHAGTRGDPNSFFAVSMRTYERQLIKDALVFCQGNITEAAKVLGVSREFIRNRAHDLGGIYDDDPPREPYTWKADKNREKSRNERFTVGGQAVDQGRPANPTDGETDRDDPVETGDEHQPDQS